MDIEGNDDMIKDNERAANLMMPSHGSTSIQLMPVFPELFFRKEADPSPEQKKEGALSGQRAEHRHISYLIIHGYDLITLQNAEH